VVLYGDTPLIRDSAIEALFEALEAGAAVGVLGFNAKDPGAYGRLILNEVGGLDHIVEAKDASPSELAVTLCNSGVIAAPAELLFSLLGQVTNNNAKGEYYLTDIVGLAREAGHTNTVVVCEEADVLGVNSRVQLAEANAAYQTRRREEVMTEGVTLVAPETVYFSYDTEIGQDCLIEPNVIFGPGVTLAPGVTVRAFSHLEGAEVETGAVIGPYARLRPGSLVGEKVRVGNFVEVKNARLEEGAKVNHLSYVGDGFVGAGANVGAGTIFCNYDGFNKNITHVGAGAFVGSNSALVAPVKIGDRAYVGSGSVITEDVPEDALSLARGRQIQREGWAIRYRAKMTGEEEE
jgi:bifunctional UDP-N-acetylglucosamine pyrophosphorylase/glucosamine-1-phosphate N-acetyltransferase